MEQQFGEFKKFSSKIKQGFEFSSRDKQNTARDLLARFAPEE